MPPALQRRPEPPRGRARARRRGPRRFALLLGLLGLLVLGAVGAGLALGPVDDGTGLGERLGLSGADPGGSDALELRAPEDTALAGPVQQSSLGPLPGPAPSVANVDLTQRSLVPTKLPAPPRAGIAFDLADGRVLWRRGATRRLSIASLTKIMTGLLAVERLRPEDRVRVPRAADQIGGSRMGGLKPGRMVRVEVLLQGLMIASGNDAAVTLAVASEGSERAFVALMNRRARQLGLQCTRFVDAHGLDARNRSCPADLAALTMRAMAQPRLERIAGMRFARAWPGSGPKLTLRTTNPLVRGRYPGAVGLKTGFTSRAGRCLVAVVERRGRSIGIVLLGAPDPEASARRLSQAAVRAAVLPAAS